MSGSMRWLLKLIVPRRALSLHSVDYRWWDSDGDMVERFSWGGPLSR